MDTTMHFTVAERLILLETLNASEGNRTTLRIITDLQGELGFSEDDHEKLRFRQENGKTFWAENTVPAKEVSFGAVALDSSLVTFTRLEQAEKLPIACFPLYERLLKEVASRAEKEKAANAPTLKAV